MNIGRVQVIMTSGQGHSKIDVSMIHGSYVSRVLPRKIFNRLAAKVRKVEPKASARTVGLKVYYLTRIIANNLFFNPQALNFYEPMSSSQ